MVNIPLHYYLPKTEKKSLENDKCVHSAVTQEGIHYVRSRDASLSTHSHFDRPENYEATGRNTAYRT